MEAVRPSFIDSFNPLKMHLSIPSKMILTAFTVISAASAILLKVVVISPILKGVLMLGFATVIAVNVSVLLVDHWMGRHRFNEFAAKHQGTYHNSDIILIVKATDDPNGALGLLSGSEVKALENQHFYKVICRNVSTVRELKHAIDEQANQQNRIHVLWILAHGSPQGFDLGNIIHDREGLDSTDVDRGSATLLKSSFQKVEEKGAILLSSCSTGKKAGRVASIAQQIDQLNVGRRVIAPKADTNFLSGKVKSIQPFDYEFRVPKYWNNSFLQLLFGPLFIFSGGRIGQDITAVYNQ